MRTYTDFQAWKTACRNREWVGPHWTGGGTQHEFVDDTGTQRATWDAETNSGSIPDEQEPGQ